MKLSNEEEAVTLPESESLSEADQCEVTVIHGDAVAKAREVQLSEEQVTDLASIFQALSDPTRLRILHALTQAEMCVCDVAAVLDMTQSAVSHQLRYLRNLRIIKRRKAGRMVYYSIDDEHILTLFETGLHHISHR